MTLSREEYRDGLVAIGKLVFDFAKVYRVTYHDDGDTRESDTDHTVMVSVIACAIADTFYKDDLDIGMVAQFAIVHDLVEVYAGDTDTFGISDTKRKEKEHREERALNMIEDKFVDVYPWIPKTIDDYEKRESKEARFVKTVDKMMSQITHILNKGVYFKKKRIGEKSMESDYLTIFDTIKAGYGKEFPLLLDLMKDLTEEARKKTYD
jgi:putative hydrolase of HD superfamily